jgi:hypothetical protein
MHLLRLTFRFQLYSGKTILFAAFRVNLESAMRVPKTQSIFHLCAHNETRSIAMRVNNPHRSPVLRDPHLNPLPSQREADAKAPVRVEFRIHRMSLIPSIIETRSSPGLTRSYPRHFTLIARTASCSRRLPWLRCRLPARLKLVRSHLTRRYPSRLCLRCRFPQAPFPIATCSMSRVPRALLPSLRNQKKLFCVWIFHDGPGRKTGDIDILVLFRQIRTRDHAFPAWDRNCVGQISLCFFNIRG